MLLALLAACTDTDKPADDTAASVDDTGPDDTDTDDTDTAVAGPAVEVRVVDPAGAPVDLDGVAWFDAGATPVPVRDALTALSCADGAPPCSVWALDGTLPARVQIVAERFGAEVGPDENGATCFEWDAPWTVVHVPDGGAPQVVHLVLNPEQRWCDDGITAYPAPALVPPTVHPDDVRAVIEAPPPALTVAGVDPAGLPLPLAVAHWYYAPEGPDYDGEHPLACADALCTTWVLPEGEGPEGGEFYVNATWMGPLHPFGDPTWTDYQGALTSPGATVTLQFDTTVALVE